MLSPSPIWVKNIYLAYSRLSCVKPKLLTTEDYNVYKEKWRFDVYLTITLHNSLLSLILPCNYVLTRYGYDMVIICVTLLYDYGSNKMIISH